MKLRLLHALIAVKMDEADEFAGLISVPIYAREELDTGTVVYAGPGETNIKGKFIQNPVKEGDRVFVASGAGIKINFDEQDLLFLTPNEITGIIRENV